MTAHSSGAMEYAWYNYRQYNYTAFYYMPCITIQLSSLLVLWWWYTPVYKQQWCNHKLQEIYLHYSWSGHLASYYNAAVLLTDHEIMCYAQSTFRKGETHANDFIKLLLWCHGDMIMVNYLNNYQYGWLQPWTLTLIIDHNDDKYSDQLQ